MPRDPFLVILPYTTCYGPSYYAAVYEPNLPLLWGIGCPLCHGSEMPVVDPGEEPWGPEPPPLFLDQIEKTILLLSSSFLWKFVADCVCRFDFLKITNENNEVPGLHCGQKNGYEVLVTGEVVLMTFHSDVHYEREGFLLQFTPIPHGEL